MDRESGAELDKETEEWFGTLGAAESDDEEEEDSDEDLDDEEEW